MKPLLEFENDKLVFEDRDVPYIPGSNITNDALLDIDVENSDEYAIDVLKNRLRMDYTPRRILDNYVVVKKREDDSCIRFEYNFNLTYTDYDFVTDETIEYKIGVNIELTRNEILSIKIHYKDLEMESTHLLSPKIDNKLILDKLTDYGGGGFIYLMNESPKVTPETIKVLKHFDLITDDEILVFDNYRSVSMWMKGVIDIMFKTIIK